MSGSSDRIATALLALAALACAAFTPDLAAASRGEPWRSLAIEHEFAPTRSYAAQWNHTVPRHPEQRGLTAEPPGGRVEESLGTARYTVPLLAPPGTAGTGPDLALEYSSGDGRGHAGWLGFGWALRGASRIARDTRSGPPFVLPDPNGNRPMCGAVPCYREVFALDGVPLACDEATCSNARFRTRHDDGRLIERLPAGEGWRIRDRAGRTHHYGQTEAGRVRSPGGEVYAWLLERTEDPHGNWIAYAYGMPADSGVAYLERIEYAQAGAPANRSVEFLREFRPDRAISYRAGFREVTDERIWRIQVRAAASAAVTHYDLEYTASPDSNRSLLERVTRFGADAASSLPPWEFAYSESQQTFEPVTDSFCAGQQTCPTSRGWFEASAFGRGATFVDVNGDGISDVYTANAIWPPEVELGTGMGFSPPVQWYPEPVPISAGQSSSYTRTMRMLVDLDGDGVLDAVDAMNGPHALLGGATGFTDPALSGATVSLEATRVSSLDATYSLSITWDDDPWFGDKWVWHAGLLDLTGDGRPDFVVATDVQDPDDPRGDGCSPTCDVDRPENWWVAHNLGRAADGSIEFSAYTPWRDPYRTGIEKAWPGSHTTTPWATADVNADGLPDRLFGAAPGLTDLAWGTGAGFDANAPANGGITGSLRRREGLVDCRQQDLLDLNGDGFPDHVRSHGIAAGEGPHHWDVQLGRGDGFAPVSEWAGTVDDLGPGIGGFTQVAFDCISQGADASSWLHADTVDLDGDGLLDHVGIDTERVWLNAGPRPDLLVFARAPSGGTDRFAYEHSGRMKTAAGLPANPELPSSRPVVASHGREDGRAGTPDSTALFHYSHGTLDDVDRDFLGFGSVIRRDLRANDPNEELSAETTSAYARDRACAGELLSHSVAEGARELARREHLYTVAAPAGVDPNLPGTWSACLLTEVRDHAVEGSWAARRTRHTRAVYGTDPIASHYNVERLEELGEVTAGGENVPGDERITHYRYALDVAGSHRVSELSEVRVSDLLDQQTFEHERRYYDDLALGNVSDGSLSRIEKLLEDPGADPPLPARWISATQEYDVYGNVTAHNAPATPGDPDGSRQEWVHDSVYVAFVSAHAAVDGGQRLETHSAAGGCPAGLDAPPGLGLPCVLTSSQGNATVRGYDPLGRLARVEHPSGLVELYSQVLPDPNGSGPAETLHELELVSTAGSLRFARVADGLGRVFRQDTPGHESSAQRIRVERSFDALGRLQAESAPHIVGVDAPLWRSFDYDALDRPTHVVELDGTTRRVTSHAPWIERTEVWLASTRARLGSREVDGLGREVRSTRFADASLEQQAFAIEAAYDPVGRLVEVRDPIAVDPALCATFAMGAACADQQHVTRLEHDSLGRRVRIHDPDSGSWAFRFDDAGQLLERVDPTGKRRVVAWDGLGRRASAGWALPGGATHVWDYTYGSDPGTGSYGQVVRVSDPTSLADYEFEYDPLGRVSTQRVLHYARRFETGLEYDELGRRAQQTYPDGETYDYHYDGLRLVGIRGGDFDILMDAQYDALGRPLRLDVGDTDAAGSGLPAARLSFGFDPNTTRMRDFIGMGRPFMSGQSAVAAAVFDVEFDGLGRLARQGIVIADQDQGDREFGFDGLDRMVSASGPWEQAADQAAGVVWSFSYDPLGNLRSRTSSSGSSAHARSWHFDDSGRPRVLTGFESAGALRNVVSDAAGRVLHDGARSFSWHHNGQLYHSLGPEG